MTNFQHRVWTGIWGKPQKLKRRFFWQMRSPHPDIYFGGGKSWGSKGEEEKPTESSWPNLTNSSREKESGG